MLMDISLPEFDVYQGTVAPTVLTLDILTFFKKKSFL